MSILSRVTLKTLQKNKLRTLVTIIGILLSAAMITAVTTSVSSLQQYMIEVVKSQDGDWYGAVYGISSAKAQTLSNDRKVTAYTTLQNLGYARLEGIQNDDKPYLFVGGMDSRFTAIQSVKVISGRLPENSGEILLPRHLKANGGLSYVIGDTLELDIGDRLSEGYTLAQTNPYLSGAEGDAEELRVRETRTYTVVGFYERPGFEDYSAPGYTALTVADGTGVDSFDAYFRVKSPKTVYTYLKTAFPDESTDVNSDLLRFMGSSNDRSFNAVLYSLAAILIAIIVFGSISLIYNAFSISVSERTRQFGLLSSVGATRRQLRQSVLFEAAVLSLVGIPLGLLAGMAGIGVTLRLTQNLFLSFMNTGTSIPFTLAVSWPALGIAAGIGVLTVLISAYIPARRAMKLSAIEAIRQAGDIRIKARKLKTSKLTYALFGFEGMLATKSFKRNKRRYRATVVSLFMSVVLFISSSSFSAYLSKSVGTIVENADYDLSYTLTPDEARKVSPDALYQELSQVAGVDQSGFAHTATVEAFVPVDSLDRDYVRYCRETLDENFALAPGQQEIAARLYFIDEEAYTAYLRRLGLDEAAYLSTGEPRAVALDFVKFYNADDGKYHTFHLLKEAPASVTLTLQQSLEGYLYEGRETDDEGTVFYLYRTPEGKQIRFSPEEVTQSRPATIGTRTDQRPFCVSNHYGALTLLYPFGARQAVLGEEASQAVTTFYFMTNHHKAAENGMVALLEKKGLSVSRLNNYAERAQSDRALLAVVNIFSYGFIVLISLIATANVFNTISTNIGLRRRELAMLKSVGMTRRSFYKMMNFECLLYGCKGLLYGIPVSIGLTYLIYRSILNGWETSFFIPWYSLVIAIGSVVIVVFATMLYAMRKVGKDNPIDALKNENL